MSRERAFLDVERQDVAYRPVDERLQDFRSVDIPLTEAEIKTQASRCMNCGTPFCHASMHGCPLGNIIPEFNALVYVQRWREALDILLQTNCFPEFTGRICPAPCEGACVLGSIQPAVNICKIELSIIEHAFDNGLMRAAPPQRRSERVAVIGSGPAGLAAACVLNRAGIGVTVYEKSANPGGLLRYGIPDFKLDKSLLDRRVAQMRAEGVEFHANTHVGVELPGKKLLAEYDAVVLAGGSEKPRDLPVPGRELEGVHYAMDFLTRNSKAVQGVNGAKEQLISAAGKHVVVIGGGDTGSDCIGTSNRHGAAKVTQIEILDKPPEKEDKGVTWPLWPNKLRTSSSQEEGCERLWNVATKAFIDDGNGRVKAMRCVLVRWDKDSNGRWVMSEVEGSEFELKADLVLLAMGFVHPVHEGMIKEFGVALDPRGNVRGTTDGTEAYKTSVDGLFAAGDMRRGQSLVVWAIREGRQCARAVDEYLMGTSDLPR